MSHNLEQKTVNGELVTSFVEASHGGKQAPAWHGLGTRFDEDRSLTIEEALRESGADYQVEMKDLFAATNPIANALADGKVDTDVMLDGYITSHKAIVRADNNAILGIVGNRYTPVQNVDAFKFVGDICSGEIGRKDVPVIETAGVLGIGERIFVTAKFSDKFAFKLGDNKEDLVNMYLTFTTNHDGKGSVACFMTPTRVVCQNTLRLAFSGAPNKLYFRHTASVLNRMDLSKHQNMEDATKVLGLYDFYKAELETKLNHLKDVRLMDKQIEKIIAEVMFSDDCLDVYRQTNNIFSDGISKQAQNLYTNVRDAVESGVGQDVEYKGRGMWLLNGFTTYFQNYKGYGDKDKARKFDGLLEGQENKQTNKAYELIMQYA